ncbi:hypothetical protein MOTC310_20325 [Methylobacterium oryzae]|uniref:Uncharacterized protein n=1 Tax=Methylobacterium oryzae TaxID=334852 RepID=A0ABU7TSG3_9HYPH
MPERIGPAGFIFGASRKAWMDRAARRALRRAARGVTGHPDGAAAARLHPRHDRCRGPGPSA